MRSKNAEALLTALEEQPLNTVADVQAALEATFNAVRRGEIDPDTGDALGELCSQRLEMIRRTNGQ